MRTRLSRTERSERNREQVLEAARQVFLERGFHAASLDHIAEAAGFSKGVVYSQFASKADMFLVLLERRITARAAELRQLTLRLPGIEAYPEMVAGMLRTERDELPWTLLVIEFRALAVREPALNQRYAALHQRTVAGAAASLKDLYARSERTPPAPFEAIAQQVLAMANGAALEDAVEMPMALGELTRAIGRILGVSEKP